jgi:hypothetical protein
MKSIGGSAMQPLTVDTDGDTGGGTLWRSYSRPRTVRRPSVLATDSGAHDADLSSDVAELWDPRTETWSKAANTPGCVESLVRADDRVLAVMRIKDWKCTATLLPSEAP